MKTLQIVCRNLTTIIVLSLLALAPAYGQIGLAANVPFGFEAGGKSLPAGTYQFKYDLNGMHLLISGAKGPPVTLQIITQIARSSFSMDSGLVFDTFEGRHVISEVWIPGMDGLLVHSTPKQHTHEMVIAMGSSATANLSGKAVFERSCARCHGPEGKGNAAADRFFQTSVPRLGSAYVQAKSDEELKDIISHGRRKMDPVRIGQAEVQHLLDPGSVDAVITYVRTLKQQ